MPSSGIMRTLFCVPIMTLIAALSILLVFGHVLGRLSERLGQPALLGHMVAGVVVGPSVLNWIHGTPQLAAIADIAVLFVVVTAGLEMRLQHVLDAFRGRGAFALLLGFMIPALAAASLAYSFDLKLIPSIVVTLCVSVTALPVALRILDGFGLLDTRVARVAISGALLSDLIVLLVLGVAIAMSQPSDQPDLWPIVGASIAKLGVLLAIVGACHWICLRLSKRNSNTASPLRQPSVDTVLILTLVFMFALGAVAELLGFHFAIGVFLASLMVTKDLISDARFQSLEKTCELITVSLFGPIFLAYQGVQFELATLTNLTLVLGVVAVAVASKLVGGYAAARLAHVPPFESVGIAIVMNARGVMEMVVASIAYRAGLIDREIFSALIVMGIATTVLTPIMLKRWMANPKFATIVRD